MSNIIEKVLVDSECIHDAKYNNITSRLTLFYKSGGVYTYERVQILLARFIQLIF